MSLTHDYQQHLLAANAGSFLHLTLISSWIWWLEPRQVYGGITCLGISWVEVDPSPHGFIVVFISPVTWVQDHLEAQWSRAGVNWTSLIQKYHVHPGPHCLNSNHTKNIYLVIASHAFKEIKVFLDDNMFYWKWIKDISCSQECVPFVLEKHKSGEGKTSNVRANQHLLCQQRAGHNSASLSPHTYSLVLKQQKKKKKEKL